MGNGEQGVGNGEWGTGCGEGEKREILAPEAPEASEASEASEAPLNSLVSLGIGLNDKHIVILNHFSRNLNRVGD